MTNPTVAPPKLPLWPTIGQAYAVWLKNFPDVVRACRVWMLLTAPVLAVWEWWQTPHVFEIVRAASTGRPFSEPDPVLTLAMRVVGSLIMLPALASVAVAWHRRLLRDERPGPGIYLRLDRIVAGYLMLAFAIGVIIAAPNYLRMIFEIATGTHANMGNLSALAVAIVAFIVAIVALFIAARLSLVLPGTALGRDNLTLGTAWRASRHNGWRMFWAYFFCVLPWLLCVTVISSWLFRPGHGRVVATLVGLVLSLLWIPIGMISVGMLSLAYRHFFERSA